MNQWTGKKVAFLGDSITDKIHVGTTKNYWQFLEEYLGLIPLVYGVNGAQMPGLTSQAETLEKECGNDVDAILVFMGTNDYNHDRPLGNWWNLTEEEINSHGQIVKKQHRLFNLDESTFQGSINAGLNFLKRHFPEQQIILLTPIHRGYANFGGDNVQPDESYPNSLGLYMEDYISVLKEAGSIWSVPVIDLYSLSGLFPVFDEYVRYCHEGKNDRLHPNAAGHERIAKTLMYQLLALPASFR